MGIVKDNLYRISNKRFIKFFNKQTIFPYYHIVKDEKVRHIENLYQYKNEKQFRNDIEVLLENYKPINPADLLVFRNLENNFLLSFDDGLEEIYSVVYPILKEKNLSAIFFVNPNFIDNKTALYKHNISVIISHLKTNIDDDIFQEISKILSINFATKSDLFIKLKETKYADRSKIDEILNLLHINIKEYLKNEKPYLSKGQIQEMINDGFYFGGHTMSHPPLQQISHEEQKAEIIDSINWLKMNFNISYSLFAFPYSDKSISKKLISELFDYDNSLLLFGNSGLKKDIDKRIIQRFSLENPNKEVEKQIVTENLYKYFNKFTSQYYIKRK